MQAAIRLIVGLGNPGTQYAATRHNAGFWLADSLADDFHVRFTQDKNFHAWVAKARAGGQTAQPIFLAKPGTFMNRSGQAVGALMRFYKLTPEQLLVLHDELDLLPGQVKLKQGGGHAGHNGLRDIQSALGSSDFWRMRIGIGHPRTLGLAQPVINFVLHPPRTEESTAIDKAMARCRRVMPELLRGEFERAMQALHNKAPHSSPKPPAPATKA